MTTETADVCALSQRELTLVLNEVDSRRIDRTQIIGALSPIEWIKMRTLLLQAFATRDIRTAGRAFRNGLSDINLREKEQIQACNIVASLLLSVVSEAGIQSWRMATKTIAE